MKTLITLLAILLVSPQFAKAADERLFAIDTQGTMRELSIDANGNTSWKPVDESITKSANFSYQSNARVTAAGLVEIDAGRTGHFVDSGLRAPPPGMNYTGAILDHSGNTAVSIGGGGRGFNYVVAGGRPVILANNQTWNPSPVPGKIQKLHAIPHSNQFLALTEDGFLYRITPPTRDNRAFTLEKVPGVEKANSVHTVNGRLVVQVAENNEQKLLDLGHLAVDLDNAKARPITFKEKDPRFLSNSSKQEMFKTVIDVQKQKGIKAQVQEQAVGQAAPAVKKDGANAPAAPKAAPAVPEKKIAELLDEVAVSNPSLGAQVEAAKEFLGGVKNMYDQSVTTYNDPNKEFTPYWGRENELQQAVDGLSKTEKSHLLITGKAGVGKTTIFNMLQDKIMRGELSFPEGKKPIILELPITSITNPSDPSVITRMIANAKNVSKLTDRRVILYVDEAHVATKMTKNAMKAFLTELTSHLASAEKGNVQFAFSTTSQESREFLDDTAFSRRWTEVHVGEFNRDETISLIKQTAMPRWKKTHQKQAYNFDGIDDDAFEYAYRFAPYEQPHAGNPTGPKELLEAAITRKMNRNAGKEAGKWTLTAEDVQEYLRNKLGLKLIPGDPNFEKNFTEVWEKFNDEYRGNPGVKSQLEPLLKSHFQNMVKPKMTAAVVFGPPGGGKSYLGETLANEFFDGSYLSINGAEYTEGGLGLNKLIGSPTGTVGSEEQRSVLTKFIKDNPKGGVIMIEEADYLHQDVVKFLTDAITKKKFTDGLGKEYDLSNYILMESTNQGQDLMIPQSPKNPMTWEQYYAKKKSITEKVLYKGKEIEVVKPSILKQVFQNFIGSIVTNSNPNQDTGNIEQEAAKQRRRFTSLYVLPPEKQELVDSAYHRVDKYIKNAKADYGVTFEVPRSLIDEIIDVENFEFEKGHSYVNDNLEDKLFRMLSAHYHERGKKITASLEDAVLHLDGEDLPTKNLVLKGGKNGVDQYSLGAKADKDYNPWKYNEGMQARLKRFSTNMVEAGLEGNDEVVNDIKRIAKLKSLDWNTRPVITLLGTTGNGKTQTLKTAAKVLWDDADASFTVSGVTDKYKLANFLRPPKGIQGGLERTEFEKWIRSRKDVGGMIILDELLSFDGLSREEIAQRLSAINELYDMLDTGFIRFGNETVDARGFFIGITGNTMQGHFKDLPDDPSTEAVVKRILSKLDRSAVTETLEKAGMDAPKTARLGSIHVMGPQPKAVRMEIGKTGVKNLVKEVTRAKKGVTVTVDENAIKLLVDELSTVELGMREFERGAKVMIKEPLSGILADIPQAKNIEMKLDNQGKASWYVDGKEVIYEAKPIPGKTSFESDWAFKSQAAANSVDRTPQLAQVGLPNKLVFSDDLARGVAVHEFYGHWMVNALLNKENKDSDISLYPGKWYLGYVRPKEETFAQTTDLSKLFRDSIMLNAGHRSEFLEGTFATGGGTTLIKEGERRSDDLGKISLRIDAMINNRLLPGYSEHSDEASKKSIKRFLGEVLDHVTDEIVKLGKNSGQFKEGFDRLLTDRYLGETELDEILRKIDFKKIADGEIDKFFYNSLKKHLGNVAAEWKTAANPVDKYFVSKSDKFVKDFEARIDQEASHYARIPAQVKPEAKSGGIGAACSVWYSRVVPSFLRR